MPSLREVQQAFDADLRSGNARALGTDIVAGNFTGERLLQVYRNNTYQSLTDALKCSYPVVARLVGDGFFGFMAHEFIDRHPSRQGNLNRYTAHGTQRSTWNQVTSQKLFIPNKQAPPVSGGACCFRYPAAIKRPLPGTR